MIPFPLELALKSLWHRRLAAVMTALSIAMSVGLLVAVESLRTGARQGFANTISGIDLLVGPRSSGVGLLLYAVFGLGGTQNKVSRESFERYEKHPAVAWAIPIMLGDSHRGFRVIGSDARLFEHYRYRRTQSLQFSSGQAPRADADAVLGAEAARRLSYPLGHRFVLSHGGGAGGSFLDHDDKPFRVAGILAPTGTPLDRAIFVTLEGMEALHEEGEHEKEDHDHHEAALSAFYLKLKSRPDTLRLQREIAEDKQEPLSAVIPGVALNELWRTLGYVETALRAVTACVLAAGLLGMLVAIYSTLEERRREMAILRAVGAGPWQVAGLLVFEAGLLATAGIGLGLLAAAGLANRLAPWIEREFGLTLGAVTLDPRLLAAILIAGLLTGLLPAWRAYRNTLSDGLTVRL